jgi:GNAT superfamily N-acetyltransferase
MNRETGIAGSFHVDVAVNVQQESREAVIRGLYQFNTRHLGIYEWLGLDVYVRNTEGRVIGGLVGDTALGWFTIHALWVEDECRRAGVGSAILRAAEEAAIRRGCCAAVLDTLSFQAPVFYERCGYTRVGVIDEYYGGMQRIFMQKRLTAVSSEV